MVIITAFKPVILPSAQTQNLFHFCFQVKRCQVEVETSESLEGIFPDDPINGCQKSSKKIRFTISGTSKFSGARQVVGKIGKEVLLRRTLAYGTRYGIGVFCLTESREQQIGWVPEKDQTILDAVGKACHLPNFHAKIDSASAKNMADKFTKITISIICEAL